MQQHEPRNARTGERSSSPRILIPLAIMILQIVASVFFVADSIEDQLSRGGQGFSLDAVVECFIALALLGGIILSSRYIVRLSRELRWNETALANAKGAFAEHIALRFKKWGLTPGEGDVALFALKGCDIAEISKLRGAAAGTIRSQLSQVYAKSGVTSHAMLVSLFIDDLLDLP